MELFRTAYAQRTCYYLRKAAGLSAAMVGVLPPSGVVFGLPGLLESSSHVVCRAHAGYSPGSTKLLSRERLEGSLRILEALALFRI